MPTLIGTLEEKSIPFSSLSLLKSYGPEDAAYKIFSRAAPSAALLDSLFRVRTATKRFEWAAYPHYEAPERFSPFLLDGRQLYYINTFESAASAMETAAVAAHNVAKLLVSRLPPGRAGGGGSGRAALPAALRRSGSSEACLVPG